MAPSVRRSLVAIAALTLLSGCCQTSALGSETTTSATGATSSTGTSGSTGAGATGSSTSGGGAPIDCGGSATLTGQGSFSVAQVVFCTQPGFDGGVEFGQFAVSLLSDNQASIGSGPFAGSCPEPGGGTSVTLFYGTGRGPSQRLPTGTYDVYPTDGGAIDFEEELDANDMTVEQSQGGSVTFSTLSSTAIAGTFEISVIDPSSGTPGELTGTFEGPFCGFLGPPGP